MSFTNKPRSIPILGLGQNNLSNEGVAAKAIEEMGFIINNQADALRKISNKLGETLFRMSKLEEQVQMQRVELRIQRDKFNIAMKTIISLGVVDQDILNICASILENKSLPITSEGRINSSITLSRYNPPNFMPAPQGADR